MPQRTEYGPSCPWADTAHPALPFREAPPCHYSQRGRRPVLAEPRPGKLALKKPQKWGEGGPSSTPDLCAGPGVWNLLPLCRTRPLGVVFTKSPAHFSRWVWGGDKPVPAEFPATAHHHTVGSGSEDRTLQWGGFHPRPIQAGTKCSGPGSPSSWPCSGARLPAAHWRDGWALSTLLSPCPPTARRGTRACSRGRGRDCHPPTP